MKAIGIFRALVVCLLSTTVAMQGQSKKITLKVLQFNIWQEGTKIPNGFQAIIDEIIHTQADLIALSEVRNYNNTNLNERMVVALKERGYHYYSLKSEDSGILSKYPILAQTAVYPLQDDHGSVTKALIDVKGTTIAFYSGHLD